MAIRSGFFNSVNGDRRYLAYNFAEYFASFIGNGVFPEPSTSLQVISKENMIISLKPGKGWINGYYIINDTEYDLVISNADGVLNRIDRVVMSLNFNSRTIEIVVKKGLFASSPIAPTLQRDQEVFELALADVFVAKGITSISQSAITDKRLDKNVCGIVTGLIDQIDTTDLFAQYNVSFNEWFDSVKEYLNETAVGNVANKLIEHEKKTMHIHWLGKTVGLNNMVVTYPEIYSYSDGLAVSFVVNQNTNNAATLNINNLGAVPIVNAAAEPQSELRANGVYTARYLNGNFMLQGSVGGVDNTAQILNLQAVVGLTTPGTIKLNWQNPSDQKYKGVRILYKLGSYPNNPTDGTVFYDSSDAVPVSTFTKNGFVDGSTYYIRAFAYTYKNATRVYTTSIDGAQVTAKPYNSKGMQTFTSSGVFTVPYGVTSIDVFLVGGGGSGGSASSLSLNMTGGGGGGGGYTSTFLKIPTNPGSVFNVIVGAGGNVPAEDKNGNPGGVSSFGTYQALGGSGGDRAQFYTQPDNSTLKLGKGGNGGSAGGYGSYGFGSEKGGSNGSSTEYATGQGTTTRAFKEASGTLFSGGGGGGYASNGSSDYAGLGGEGGGGKGATQATYAPAFNGTPNTGGGGGGAAGINGSRSAGSGGSGIVIVRWGY